MTRSLVDPTREGCPVCRAKSGQRCNDVRGAVTINGSHPQRAAWVEASELTRWAFIR